MAQRINLCSYCWGGGLYPSLGHPRVSSLSETLTTGVQPWTVHVHHIWSDLLLEKNVIAHQTNLFSLQYFHQQRKNWHSCFDSSNFISTFDNRRLYCSSKPDLIRYYTKTWLPAKPISSPFIINSNWRGTYLVNLTPFYCAPELYNNLSILKNIDNWNTKTTDINIITFSIKIQFKIHQTLIQLHSASHFKSKYIVFRDT